MSDPVVKSELKQVSNYVGAAVITVGNLLPYLTPATLAAIGVPSSKLQIASTVVGLLCLAYREKQAAPGVTLAVPSTTPGDTNAKP